MGDLEKDILKEIEQGVAEAVIRDVANELVKMTATPAAGILSVSEDTMSIAISNGGTGITGPVWSNAVHNLGPDDFIRAAEANYFVVVEKTTIEQSIAIMEEEEFKRITKERLATKLREIAAKKAKYTMLKDPRDGSVTTKAKIYMFSEQELKTFIGNILHYSK